MEARRIAYEILCDVFIGGSYANLDLRKKLEGLKKEDKVLVTKIVYGTIRNYGLLEFQYKKYLTKTLPKDIDVILLMATYQLLMLDKVPAYAIINEAVNLAKKAYKGLVNAVLRRVSETGLLYSNTEDDLLDLSINTSIPLWIINLLKVHYGKETCIKICESFLEDAITYGRINSLLVSKEDLSKDDNINFIDDYALTYNKNLVNSTYFKEGKLIIQDYSSQQVAKYLDLKENLSVLDTCASPGSKTSQIAMMMNNTGKVIAIDIHKHRVDLIDKLCQRLQVKNVEATLMDARQIDEAFYKAFDRVLVDAPCSGLGVLRGKADIKLSLKPEDIDEICKLQKEILFESSKCLKEDGILVYSTCTLNKKENERQIEAFLIENPDFVLLESKTIFPYEYKSDGFYIAKLRKVYDKIKQGD